MTGMEGLVVLAGIGYGLFIVAEFIVQTARALVRWCRRGRS